MVATLALGLLLAAPTDAQAWWFRAFFARTRVGAAVAGESAGLRGSRASSPRAALSGLSEAASKTTAAAVLFDLLPSRASARVYASFEDGQLRYFTKRSMDAPVEAISEIGHGRVLSRVLEQIEQSSEQPPELIVDAEVLASEEFQSSQLPPRAKVSVIAPDGQLFATRITGEAGNMQRMIELRPNLLARANDARGVESFVRAQAYTFERALVDVVALLDETADLTELRALKKVAGEGMRVPRSAAELQAYFADKAGGIVALVAHFERVNGVVNAVVLDARSTPTLSIPLVELQRMAQANDASLILLGCDTARQAGAAGYLTRVSASWATERLASALGAGTWSGFLKRLGSPETPLVLSSELLDDNVILRLSTQETLADSRTVPSIWVSSSTLQRARASQSLGEIDLSFVDLPGWWRWLVVLGGTLASGAIPLLGAPRLARRVASAGLLIAGGPLSPAFVLVVLLRTRSGRLFGW